MSFDANSWLNLLWIAVTLPISFSEFMIKAVIERELWCLIDIYPKKEYENNTYASRT